jgi:hypothetical protein
MLPNFLNSSIAIRAARRESERFRPLLRKSLTLVVWTAVVEGLYDEATWNEVTWGSSPTLASDCQRRTAVNPIRRLLVDVCHQGKRVAARFATRVLNDPRALDRSPEGERVGYHEIGSYHSKPSLFAHSSQKTSASLSRLLIGNEITSPHAYRDS